MTREERLTFCKACVNKAFSPQQGIICGLTNQIAAFERTCENFVKAKTSEPELKSYLKTSKRGFWLSFMVVLVLLNGVGLALISISTTLATFMGEFIPYPLWYSIALIVPAAAYSVGAVLMLLLKRMGIYVFITGFIIYGALKLISGIYTYSELYGTLVISIIGFMIIAPKWDNFE